MSGRDANDGMPGPAQPVGASVQPAVAELGEDAPHCLECDYPLVGLTEPRCPECGTPFDPAVPYYQHTPLFPLRDGRRAGFLRLFWLSIANPDRLALGLRADAAAAHRYAWLTAFWIVVPVAIALALDDLRLLAVLLAGGIVAVLAARVCELVAAGMLAGFNVQPRAVREDTYWAFWRALLRMGAGFQPLMMLLAPACQLLLVALAARTVLEIGFVALGAPLLQLAIVLWWLVVMVRMVVIRSSDPRPGLTLLALILGTATGIVVAAAGGLLILLIMSGVL